MVVCSALHADLVRNPADEFLDSEHAIALVRMQVAKLAAQLDARTLLPSRCRALHSTTLQHLRAWLGGIAEGVRSRDPF